MKRFISLALTAMMLLALIPFSAFSASAVTDANGFIYIESDDKSYYILTGYEGSAANVTVPSSYNGLPVKEIRRAFINNSTITSVSVPSSVEVIQNYAFGNCTNLSTVSLVAGLKTIDSYSFTNCPSLKNITLPSTLETIGDFVFYKSSALESVNIPSSVKTIELQAFYGTGLKSVVIPNGVTILAPSVFEGCKNLSSVSIPDSVLKIDARAFFGCTSLNSVLIPNSVKEIGARAFAESGLTSVTIPGSVTTMNGYTFLDCASLRAVKISDSVTKIGFQEFSGCDSLTDIYCEAKSQPASWDYSGWLSGCDATVHWGSNVSDGIMLGDVNCDGLVDKSDYNALKRYCFGTTVLSAEGLAAANVNGDDDINKQDYLLIKRHCFGTASIG